LGAPIEQLGQRLGPVLCREPVLLLDRDPRQLAPALLDTLGVLLQLALDGQQLLACGPPLLLRPDLHRTSFVLNSSSLDRCHGGKLIGRPKASNGSGRLQSTPRRRAPPPRAALRVASGR